MTKSPRVVHLSFVICHLSFVICLAACARPDDTWDRVLETGTLRVGMDASFPPFETITADGTLVGFDVDLARELGRRSGPALDRAEEIEVQFVANLPYDGLYDALAVGRVDVVISALVINPARMGDFAYSTPYFDAGQVLVVRVKPDRFSETCQVSDIEGMADLDGCTLAVEFGTQGDLEARKWARRLSSLTVVPYQTAAEALAMVAAGEADVALVDHVSALAAIKTLEVSENPNGFGLVIVGEPVVEEPYAVAVQRESQRLLQAINEALAEMEADGTMKALVERWMLTPEPGDTTNSPDSPHRRIPISDTSSYHRKATRQSHHVPCYSTRPAYLQTISVARTSALTASLVLSSISSPSLFKFPRPGARNIFPL